jgi:hypothetical protein
MSGAALLDELGRFEGDAELLQAWRDGMMPEPLLMVSEWADRHRMLGSRDSAEPGPYRTARTPYLREVMDALSPSHPARRVVFMKGAQVGATTVGSNWIGYVACLRGLRGMSPGSAPVPRAATTGPATPTQRQAQPEATARRERRYDTPTPSPPNPAGRHPLRDRGTPNLRSSQRCVAALPQPKRRASRAG